MTATTADLLAQLRAERELLGPTPHESAVAALCTLLTDLEQLTARVRVELDRLTDLLPPVDELAAARETGDGLAQAAEQAAAFVDRRASCACGEVDLEHEDQLVYRNELIHGNPVCVLERVLA